MVEDELGESLVNGQTRRNDRRKMKMEKGKRKKKMEEEESERELGTRDGPSLMWVTMVSEFYEISNGSLVT